ncbi:GNAT family N-acetyltransferase [Mucilaginibacter sp. SP1R1]|uniref:GNAT family N-acetyltransferase n=1 Tax=Mucilaginibacter sp. SP1R1 TaxID=2723091 RepID=UPI00161DB52B|nr:GNAT family N-acetyltransferase [Mucilaginibacter sp. SP1R1]MBB6147747.1 GNAT superfamily N-acetyltransferase [Mucilaginibacter sp. SP1R1]
MTITTRPATFDDIPVLQQLIALSVRGLSTGYNTPNQIESALKYVFGVDTQLVTDGTYYVAQIRDTIVGCGGWSKRNKLYGGDQHKEIEDQLLNPEYDAARIRAFFVHPNWARRGIGRHIMQVCENAAQTNGFKSFQLGATLPGVPLYEVMGYSPVEYIDQPMPNGEVLPIVKMQKVL